MALDFPSPATTGQPFTGPSGVQWVFDGQKWVAGTGTAPLAVTNNVGRNLIHNSMFNIAQRGYGPWARERLHVGSLEAVNQSR